VQTGSSNRWGDYSSMSVDPTDDCTFWYTQEYYETTGSFDFNTRICSFKFADCGVTLTCTVDADCDNGLYCDGEETCNVDTCQAGTAPSIDDGVSCTVDSCNEGTGSIDNTPNDSLCDNGLFCDGNETCDAINDCQTGNDPCAVGEICEESGDICVLPPVSMHIRSIVTGTQPAAKGRKLGKATVTIRDNNGDSVGTGIEVFGNFSGSFDETGSAFTGIDGIAVILTAGTKKRVGAPDFCVSDVVGGSLTYEASDNPDPGFACGAPPDCGNGIIESGEICDGTDLGGETCISLGFESGTLACQTDNCENFDTKACVGEPFCVPTHNKEKGSRCSDGLDNDCDGLIDGDDPDC